MSGEKNKKYQRRPDGKCAAMLKGRSEDIPCKRWAMAGQAVCPVHGGKSPQAKKAAAKRLATERATRVMERSLSLLDIDAETAEKLDPRDVLLGALRHAVIRHEWWRRVVAAHSEDGERPAALQFVSAGQYGDTQSVHVFETLLGHWHDRVVAAAKACISAGLDERAVAAAEEQARAALATAAASDIAGFERRLRAAGFDDEQVATVLLARVGE